MAITFTQEQKKQKYLLFALVAIVFITLLIIWRGFSKKEELAPFSPPPLILPFQRLEVNWDVLKDERLKGLKAVEEISLPQNNVGRKNPFISY